MSVSSARVAILMATHNDGQLLERAILSICGGTYPVDLYLVDDCSNPPAQVPSSVSHRVHLVRLDENLGLTRALNAGLRQVLAGRYDYIGRMDADDISHPERIEKQVKFLERNPDISGVGCWANYVASDTSKSVFICRPPTESREIQRELHHNNCMLHPTWLLRTQVFDSLNGYNERYLVAQDYEFIARASKAGYKFSNVPEVLLDYRISPLGISVKRRRQQLFARLLIQIHIFAPLRAASWIGIAKTTLLFLIPASLVKQVKTFRHRTESKEVS